MDDRQKRPRAFKTNMTDLPDPPIWRVAPQLKAGQRAPRTRRGQKPLRALRPLPPPVWLQAGGYTLLGLFLAAILAGFLYYVLPAATITLVPGQSVVETTLILTADPLVESLDLEQGKVPGRLVEVDIEQTGRMATSGSGRADVERAQGTVVFINQTNRTVRIPAGTVISTSTGDRIDFRTRAEITLPGPTGTQVLGEVQALEPGEQGNVRANTLTTVSGALRTQLRVTNPAPTAGGLSRLVRVVRQVDRDSLHARVYEDIRSQAEKVLLPKLRADEWLPPQSTQTLIMAQFFDHFNDEPADELTLTLRVRVRGLVISQDANQAAVLAGLRKVVPAQGQLVADSIAFRTSNVVVNGRTVRYGISAQGQYVTPIDSRAVSRSVAGLSIEEAARQLEEEWLLAKNPTFYQDPAWFNTLPQLANRIQVRLEMDDAARQ